PAFETPFSAETPYTAYDLNAVVETLAERLLNRRRSHGKMTNPEVFVPGDVVYATLKHSIEGGSEKTTSVRTDIIEDAKIKKSLIGVKADDVAKIDVKKAFKVADLARILGVTEDEAANLDVTKFELTVKNINRLEEADLNQE